MDILLPIGIGFLSNTLIFIVSMFMVKNSIRATNITLIFVGLSLVISLIIGGWSGMGLGVIGLGMLLATICLYIIFMYKFVTEK
ncbi:hypothetical protein HOO54_13810 [Bacillus sp. WMMC1349]|uniref:YesK family protein n=1 Tax=Bacillus sp. WMMC1349 TaxID=2736254 RepID=UPI001551E853|nr:YesK family protein [Bacillus sp. WMMC1349]NPC93278.1 hypothetical protein [Bacillus sp. WMMC1349]